MPKSNRTTTNRSKSSRKPPKASSSKARSPGEVATEGEQPIYFWKPHEVPYGIFSQWHVEDFSVPNGDGTNTTFGTAEQYMMYRKAVLFNDAPTASEILTTTNPRTQRTLGRRVKNFDEDIWRANRSPIVEEGSYWKFKRDPSMLVDTGERELVEASPMDRIWGIGYGPTKANTRDRHKWGMNLLGKALMEARRRINEEIGAVAVAVAVAGEPQVKEDCGVGEE